MLSQTELESKNLSLQTTLEQLKADEGTIELVAERNLALLDGNMQEVEFLTAQLELLYERKRIQNEISDNNKEMLGTEVEKGKIEQDNFKKEESFLAKNFKDKEKIQKATEKGKEKMTDLALKAVGINRAEDTKEGIRTAYGMAGKAYEAMAVVPIIGPALGVAAAAVAFALGMSYVSKINKAATVYN